MKKKKFKSKVKGVTCTTINGVEYWYVWMDGVRHRADSQKDAEDARRKYDARKIDAQRTGLDLKTKGAFADFTSMANWYLTVPKVKKLASYDRACGVVANLVNYFGKIPVAAINPARQEDYRDHRREKGAVEATINLEITYLAMIFKLALKRKKIHPHQMPGEFVRATKKEVEKESPPRRLISDEEYQKILDHAPQDFRDVCI